MNDFESAKTLFLDGISLLEKDQYSQAEGRFIRSLELLPNRVSTLTNLSVAQLKQKKYSDAKKSAEQAIKLEANNVEAHLNLGIIEKELKNLILAISYFDKILKIAPNFVEAHLNKGFALTELIRYQEGINCFDNALDLKPHYAEALAGKAIIFCKQKRFVEANECFDRAINSKSDYAEALAGKGVLLCELRRYKDALAYFDKALAIKPSAAQILANKAYTLIANKQYEESIEYCDRALEFDSVHIEALANKGFALEALRQHDQAAACFMKASNLSDGDNYLLGQAHHQMMLIADWTNYDSITQKIFIEIEKKQKIAEPFGFQGIAESEYLLKECALIYSQDKYPPQINIHSYKNPNRKKIRVGYLCGEFRRHATSILMTRIWELHDRSQFELFAFDNGWNDHSEYRKRIEKSFNKIFDISKMSDWEAAKLIQSNEIDILVNLNGYFGLIRQEVFAYKPARIQVNYLGFPGTLGAPYIDYIIADRVVIPESSRKFYSEKVVYLPNSYQANDNQRKISNMHFSRSQFGLPENAFIFACFNNTYKITPKTFDSWAKILGRVQGSILWLLADTPAAQKNLIKEVVARGIGGDRLVFADRLEPPEHLARQGLANLFLDTLPYNAHTTASDALWSGLPVLTQIGNTFPGRVSASLLNALGMSNLVANSDTEYEALAIALATDPRLEKNVRDQLVENRKSKLLFNSEVFTKNLESAYLKMIENSDAGRAPSHITIE